ncbi:MAG: hypothetical protein H7Y13_16825 [Sphingobacteriaceae bacterium]|nr:hypothetical protein [Sphingobacteriaceae bacterium]
MFAITIEKNTKIENIETYFTRLSEAKTLNVEVDLLLPKELKYYYLGLVPALLQFILTWLRYENSGKLLIDIDELNEEAITEL